MIIQTISYNKNHTIDETYQLTSPKDPYINEILLMMQDLLRYLRDNPPDIHVWAYTSHTTLVLTNQDTAGTGIAIDALGGRYIIEYMLPTAEAPWPGAYMGGRADTVNEAAAIIYSAINHLFNQPPHNHPTN